MIFFRNFSKLCFIIMSLLLSVMAASQPTASAKTDQKNWYKVEIIIFSQVPYGEKQNEIWPELPAFTMDF